VNKILGLDAIKEIDQVPFLDGTTEVFMTCLQTKAFVEGAYQMNVCIET